VKLRHILFNRVKSDTGFIVKIRPLHGFAEFREGKRVAIVPVRLIIGEGQVHVYKDTIFKWNPPYDADNISEEKRKEILQNVVEAMRFRKFPAEIV
jgi:hypothetical protein